MPDAAKTAEVRETSLRIRQGGIAIEFGASSPVSSQVYDVEKLKRFEFFKGIENPGFLEVKEGKCLLADIDHALFEIVYALVIEGKPFHEIITEDILQSPTFFEDFSKTINFLHPGAESTAIIKKMEYALSALTTLQVAERVIETYRTRVPGFSMLSEEANDKGSGGSLAPAEASSGAIDDAIAIGNAIASLDAPPPAADKGEKSDKAAKSDKDVKSEKAMASALEAPGVKKQKYPVLVSIARQRILYALPLPRKRALEVLEDHYLAFMKKEVAEAHTAKLQQQLSKHATPGFAYHVKEKTRSNEYTIDESNKLIDSNNKIFTTAIDFSKLTLLQKITFAAEQRQHKDLQIKKLAEQIGAEVDALKQKVMDALRGSDADTTREDLIPDFMCLLDFYGIEIAPDGNAKLPFKKGEHRFSFNLRNNRAYDLELEIIRKFQNSKIPRPTRESEYGMPHEAKFFDVDNFNLPACTKPQTMKSKAVRNVIQPILARWDYNAGNPAQCTLVKQSLIDHFQWGERDIKPQDLSIAVCKYSKMFYSDIITVIFNKVSKSIDLNLWDLETVYVKTGGVELIPSIEQLLIDTGVYTSTAARTGDSCVTMRG